MTRVPLPIDMANGLTAIAIVTGLGPAESQTFFSLATVLESPGLCPQEVVVFLDKVSEQSCYKGSFTLSSPTQTRTNTHKHTQNFYLASW